MTIKGLFALLVLVATLPVFCNFAPDTRPEVRPGITFSDEQKNSQDDFDRFLKLANESGGGNLYYDDYYGDSDLVGNIVMSKFLNYCFPYEPIIPVKGATSKDWNVNSFWATGWGQSVTHKGIDIFHPRNTPVIASNAGLVIWSGEIQIGGNVVFILTPNYKIHYYAHLEKCLVKTSTFVNRGDIIGKVGDSGNAKGKSPHLHFEIKRLIPDFSKADSSKQGYRKVWRDNPGLAFTNAK